MTETSYCTCWWYENVGYGSAPEDFTETTTYRLVDEDFDGPWEESDESDEEDEDEDELDDEDNEDLDDDEEVPPFPPQGIAPLI